MTMFHAKSDIFLLAGLYLLSRCIGKIGAKRMLWGNACFIDTPRSDSHDESRRADGPPWLVAGLGPDIRSRRARRPLPPGPSAAGPSQAALVAALLQAP